MKTKQPGFTPQITPFPSKLTRSQTEITEHLAYRITHRVDGYLPENHLLDQIVEGEITLEQLDDLDLEPYCCFEDVLEAVNWWRQLEGHALDSKNSNGNFRPNPNFAAQRLALSFLLGEVLSAFLPAHQETSNAYNEYWGTFGPKLFEFLKRYRLYTRYVESFTLEIFPDLDRELLLNPDFGFMSRKRLSA